MRRTVMALRCYLRSRSAERSERIPEWIKNRNGAFVFGISFCKVSIYLCVCCHCWRIMRFRLIAISKVFGEGQNSSFTFFTINQIRPCPWDGRTSMILILNENLDDKTKPREIVLKRNKKAKQAEECSRRYDESEEKRQLATLSKKQS